MNSVNEKLILEGNAWKYGDHVNTDVIIPARYLNTIDPDELASHCMEDIDASFAENVKKGDILVAGENFGCGSSREHAPIAIKSSGISCIIASSFARIFFRNCINIGLPLFEQPTAANEIHTGDEIRVDVDSGVIQNLTQKTSYQISPLPPFIQQIVQVGGLMNYVNRSLSSSKPSNSK